MIPKHYSLKAEHPKSYEIHDDRDGKTFHVAKSGLDLGMHAKLSKIKKYSDGGDIEPTSTPVPSETPFDPDALSGPTTTPPRTGFLESVGQGLGGGAAGFATALGQGVNLVGSGLSDLGKGFSEGVNQVPGNSPAPSPDATNDVGGPQAPLNLGNSGMDQTPDQTGAALQALPESQNQILQGELNAIQGAQAAQAKQARDTANAYAAYNVEHEVNMDDLKTDTAARQAQDDELLKNYMGKKLDPDHYWQNKSTGSKIGAALALTFGGMGAAMAGGPNYAQQSINSAIDRDMEAQRADKSDAMNAWKMHREATGDNMAANLAFQNQALLGVQSKAAEYAARAGNPAAQIQYAQLAGNIRQQIAQNNFHQSILQSSNQPGNVLAVDPSLLLPSIPADKQGEAAKEISHAQRVKALQADMEGSAKDLSSQFMNGLLSPHDRDSAVNAFAGQIAKEGEGRFNLDESKLQANALLPGPGDTHQTLSNKAQRRQQFFSGMVQGPVFKGATGIDLGKFKSTSTGPQQTDADIQKRAQIMYAQQNLNNRDPVVQRRVQFVRQKYGI